MGKYMRKGKRVGAAAVEVTHASMGVRTRARTLALEQNQKLSVAISDSITLQLPQRIENCYLELRSRKLEKVSSRDGGNNLVLHPSVEQASCGAEAAIGLEIEVSLGDNTMDYDGLSAYENKSVAESGQVRDLREGTPTSNFSHMEITAEAPGSSTRVRVNQRFRVAALRSASESLIVPAPHEIEEFFFHTEEQQLQSTLSERYNFDFRNGVPLEGRFEWCSLHQLQ
ncbi:hypothetical protein O6H91_09G003300 [Diphasiastrum complanatum]|uniref:Uncharacterized protein n=1 Tax=Diphasiastrum complanatum TaxID=34168 RepID=A0ACC2CKY2_DIPCM|nr:hypothetical protein O6H91_Y086400 [Diphasiastrum complanatum]KAJ7542618.1 hypothetical protein O6H91_09G003300 [Diphasiastrum complanatum]